MYLGMEKNILKKIFLFMQKYKLFLCRTLAFLFLRYFGAKYDMGREDERGWSLVMVSCV